MGTAEGEALSDDILNTGGALGALGTLAAVAAWVKAHLERAALRREMRDIAIAVVNPEARAIEHKQLSEDIAEIKTMLQGQQSVIRDATLAGVQAGYRMVIKKREDEA